MCMWNNIMCNVYCVCINNNINNENNNDNNNVVILIMYV